MKRKIIKIDEEKCNGCGLCVPDCPEGAIQIVDGKAKLVGESLCDGLGACLGRCPEGAITIEEREAEEYDEIKVMENVVIKGEDTVKAHMEHLEHHGQHEDLAKAKKFMTDRGERHHRGGGCPGSMMRTFDKKASSEEAFKAVSELRQWPVQLKLLNPEAPYFKGADVVIAADCVAYAFGDFHRRFLKDKVLIVFCPKLDAATEEYVEKLAQIIKSNEIKSLTIARMEVPCCGGTTAISEEAVKRSGKQVLMKEYTISLEGDII